MRQYTFVTRPTRPSGAMPRYAAAHQARGQPLPTSPHARPGMHSADPNDSNEIPEEVAESGVRAAEQPQAQQGGASGL